MKLEKQIKTLKMQRRKEIEPQQMLGGTLKYHRRKQKRTLNEISKKTEMSISYISKLENNVIQMTYKNARRLFDVLNIKEDVLIYSKNMIEWYDDLFDVVLELGEDHQKLKRFIESRDDYQSKLIDFTIKAVKNDLKGCEMHLTLLINQVDTMTMFESNILLMAIANYLFHQQDYKYASECIDLIKETPVKNAKFNLWVDLLKYKLSLLTGNFTHIHKLYQQLTNECLKFELEHILMDIRNDYIAYRPFIATESYFEELMEFKKHPMIVSQHFLNQLCRNYDESLLDSIIFNEQCSPFVCSIAYWLSGDYDNMDKQMSMFCPNQLHKLEKHIYDYMVLSKHPENILPELRKRLNTDPFVINNMILLHLYGELLIQYYQKNHKYKDAIAIWEYVKEAKSDIKKHFYKN
ncbi:MAG: helix-turn-helix domain-containing protein [Acholeplasma sp.]|nr:helix-turn-helix domain-containing protein [Acholeplasma sp.]